MIVRQGTVPDEVLAAVAAALSVVLEKPLDRYRLEVRSPGAPVPGPTPWALAGRLALMEKGRRGRL